MHLTGNKFLAVRTKDKKLFDVSVATDPQGGSCTIQIDSRKNLSSDPVVRCFSFWSSITLLKPHLRFCHPNDAREIFFIANDGVEDVINVQKIKIVDPDEIIIADEKMERFKQDQKHFSYAACASLVSHLWSKSSLVLETSDQRMHILFVNAAGKLFDVWFTKEEITLLQNEQLVYAHNQSGQLLLA